MIFGGIEAGGTKIICGTGEYENGKLEIRESAKFPTERPEIVIPRLTEWFREHPVAALGVASFGPLDLNRCSPTYGFVMDTPKDGWQHVDFLSPFRDAFHIPVAFDTDVNGAALGEAIYGAGKGCGVVVYMTVGTGIGVGVYQEGKLLHGLIHPEAGHMRVVRRGDDQFAGTCGAHPRKGESVCLEGYASGPAIEKRWGEKGENLMDREEVWDLEAWYLSQGVTNLVLMYSPEKIILGGGVMHRKQLFPMIRDGVREYVGGYVRSPMLEEKIGDYIVPPLLEDRAGLTGAIELGRIEWERQQGK